MKITEVKNVGSISSINKEVDLGRRAVIYGLNGAGKSTLKSLFTTTFEEGKSLIPSFDSTVTKCGAKISLFGREINYAKGKSDWTPKKEKIYVFDEKYVENNIYLNGGVSFDNQKEHYRILVGDQISQSISLLIDRSNESKAALQNYNIAISDLESSFANLSRFNEISKMLEIELKEKNTIESLVESSLEKQL